MSQSTDISSEAHELHAAGDCDEMSTAGTPTSSESLLPRSRRVLVRS